MSPEDADSRDETPADITPPAALLEVPLRGTGGEDQGRLTLDPGRLDRRVRHALLKEAAVMYAANKRVGTHETKTRGQVRGSTRKPWKQKGTGRARAGTRKSPLWRGGGVVFGPHPRDYSYQINRKQKRLALRSALLGKFRDGQVIVIDGLAADSPKTKPVARVLGALGVKGSCLIGTARPEKNLVLAARNIPGVVVSAVKDLNALDVLNARTVLLTREAFDALSAPGIPHDPTPGIPHDPAPGIPHDPAPGIPHDPAPGTPHDPAPGTPHDPAPGREGSE
jgi:large subunit ribosomal protein L4